MSEARLEGLLAEFTSAEQLLAAVGSARAAGFGALEAYSPFPVEGMADALGYRRNLVPLFMLLGAIVGGVGTFALEWYSAVLNFPLNVGGRPLGSWPAFLPAAIEMTLLWAAVCGVLAMLIGNRLPQLHHPLFGVRAFERASNDRFFMLLRATGAGFETERAREFLATLAPLSVSEVPA